MRFTVQHTTHSNWIKRIILLFLLFALFVGNTFAIDYYQRQSGNWNSANSWTTDNGWNGTANTGTYPQAGDNAHFKNNGNAATITLTADAACTNLYFDNSGQGVIAMGNYNLIVSNSWTSDWGNTATITQGTGYIQINGLIETFNIAKTILNFRVGSGSLTFSGSGSLTVSSNYDYNCFTATVPAGINAASATKSNATPCSPAISATTLTSFGTVCPNTTVGPNSFTISALALTTANVTVAALNGFSYSTTSGGTYTNTLSLTQGGGQYSKIIYVKFTPTTTASYNGNIVVGGGGAPNINVAAVGSGANSVSPTVTSPTSTNVMSTSATLGGTITIEGCTSNSIIERGIYYSTTNGFPNGTGTKVSETGTFSTGIFTVNLTGLSPSTTYYFKAFATNGVGTGYSSQGTFSNVPRTYYSWQSGDWTSTTTWSTVACGNSTNTGSYPVAYDNVIICQPHVITVNTTGLSCSDMNMEAYGTRLILNNDFTINGNLAVANQSYISVGTNNLTINGDFTNTSSPYYSRIEYSSGNVTIGGNITVEVGGGGIQPFNCSGTGWLTMSGTSKTFSVSDDIIVPRFRQPVTGFTKGGNKKITITSIFDQNCGPAQTSNKFDVTGTTINTTCTTNTITGSNITGSPFCAGNTVSIPYTISGTFNSGNIFTAQLSDATGSFASPVSLGTLTQTTAGTISGTIPVNTASGTAYRIRVISSNPVITGSSNASNLTITALPQGSLSANGPFCGTSGAGMLTWTATAGTGPYTVVYNDGTANRTQTNVSSGTPFATAIATVAATTTYTLVSVTGSSSCARTSGFTAAWATITVSPTPQGSLSANGPFCATGAGQLTWTASAGTGPYTVIYNDGLANRTASGVISGTPFATFTTPVTSTTNYTLVSVTGTGGCIRSSGFTGGSATITVNPSPQGSLSANGPFCSSGAGQLTWTATSGTGPYTVVYNDGTANRTKTNVTSATPFATFTTPVTTATTYTLVSVTGTSGCQRTTGFTAGSTTISVSATAPAQPSTITGSTTPGQSTSQVYSVTNIAGTSYAWTFPSGWTQTAGGTSNSVTVTVGSASGNITVTPSNACGTGTARTLAVTVASCITNQPVDRRICPNTNTTFSITTSGTCRWQVLNTDNSNGVIPTWTNLNNGGIYSGTTTATLTLTNVSNAYNKFQYRCVATCSSTATSTAATLYIGLIDNYILSVDNPLINIAPKPGPYNSILTLLGSQTGVSYQLRTGTTNVGAAVVGTGGPISFASVMPTLSTNYNVLATGCTTIQMISTKTIVVNNDNLIIDLNPCAGQPGANFFTNSEFGTTSTNHFVPTFQASFPGVSFGAALGGAYTPYTYGVDGGNEVNDNYYVVANSTEGMYRPPRQTAEAWMLVQDRYSPGTGNIYIVNADLTPGAFYTETMYNLCDSTKYEFSADIINIINPEHVPNGRQTLNYYNSDNQGNAYTILPNIDFMINGKVALNTGNLVNDGQWHTFGFTFRTGGLSSIDLTIRNNSVGGIGNDLALDNIVMRACGPSIQLQITTVPAIVCPGEPVTMTGNILASDYNSPVYQWQKSTDAGNSWTNLSGFTVGSGTTTYVENNPVYGHQYRFITGETTQSLSNSNCYVASNVITIETTADILTTTPATRCGTGTATLSATANPGATIKWYSDAGGTVQVGTGASYTTPSLSATTSYYVNASKDGCTSPLKTVVATVYPSAVSPAVTIAVSPGTNICSGNTVTFTATPTNGGTAPLYQWKKNGVNISGATNSTYTTNTIANNNAITCLMTENPNNACITGDPGTATSNQITMTVGAMAASVSIAASPGTTVCSGSPVTFTATPTNGGSVPTYQWKLNGSNISGATNSTYTSSSLANGSQITCVMTSSFVCATNNPATSSATSMTINPLPTISTTGTIASVGFNTSAQTSTLSYTASTNNPISYSINWDASANTAGLLDQGTTAFTFAGGGGTINNIAVTASTPSGSYSGLMTISNANGCIATQAVSLIISSGPTITTTGTITAQCYNTGAQTSSLTYSATTNSPTSYSIDWNATANTAGLADQGSTTFAFLPGGGTINNIAITAGTPAGTYSGTMTISNGNTSTQAVTVTIYPQPVINTDTQDLTLCETDNGSFTVATSPSGNTFQWEYSSNPITTWTITDAVPNLSGHTSNTLDLTNASLGFNNNNVRCVVTSVNNCIINSTPALLLVNSPYVDISTSYVTDCPELEATQGFLPDNASYDPGATQITFTLSLLGTSSTNWTYDYVIENATVRTGAEPGGWASPNPQSGTSVTVTGSTSETLTFYINNNPGSTLSPTLKITLVKDEFNCTDNTNRTLAPTIDAMPSVGSFN